MVSGNVLEIWILAEGFSSTKLVKRVASFPLFFFVFLDARRIKTVLSTQNIVRAWMCALAGQYNHGQARGAFSSVLLTVLNFSNRRLSLLSSSLFRAIPGNGGKDNDRTGCVLLVLRLLLGANGTCRVELAGRQKSGTEMKTSQRSLVNEAASPNAHSRPSPSVPDLLSPSARAMQPPPRSCRTKHT